MVDSFPQVPNFQWTNGVGNSTHVNEPEDDLAHAYPWAVNLGADDSANNNNNNLQTFSPEPRMNVNADNGISNQPQPIGGWWYPTLPQYQFGQMGAGNSANYITTAPQGPVQPYDGSGTINPAALSMGHGAANQTAPLAGMMQQNAAPEPSTRPLAQGLDVAPVQQVAAPVFVPAQQVPAQEQPAPAEEQPVPAEEQPRVVNGNGTTLRLSDRAGNRQGATPAWKQAKKHHEQRCNTLQAGDGCVADCMLREYFPQTYAKWSAQRFQVKWRGAPAGSSETVVVSGFAVGAEHTYNPGFVVIGELLSDGTLKTSSKTVHRVESQAAV